MKTMNDSRAALGLTRTRLATALGLAASLGALPAHAQSSPTLSEVRVEATAQEESATGPVIGYQARRAVTATKTDTPLSETPQSVTVVTRDQMIDQGATTFQEALSYAAGVRSDAYGLDSRSDGVRVRGGYPDYYLDGLRQNYNYYTSTARNDPYTLERIEVLRGPSGMLFGAGDVAGVVNMVSKRPLQETQREVGLQLGSWNRRQLQADLTGPLTADGQWSYRLVTLARKADTQVDHVPDDRRLLAPSLAWRPNASTSLTLQAYLQQDRSGTTAQFLPWSGTLLPNPNGQLPLSRFIGEPGDRYDTDRKSFGWLFEHAFNDQWTVRQNLRLANNKNTSAYHWADFVTGWLDPSQRTIGRYYADTVTRTRMATADTHLQGKLATGAVHHQVLLGLDWNRQSEDRDSASTLSTIDAYAPVYGNLATSPRTPRPRNVQRQTGLYLQDQMSWGPWIVVAGLRRDNVVNSLAGSADDKTSDTTKRLGLMYKLANGWTPYISYAESFSPVSGTNFYNERFKPLEGEQVEVGAKYMSEGGSSQFTASVYDLKEKNRSTPDPSNAENTLQTGKTRTQGLELEFKSQLSAAFSLIAHYNYTDVDKALEGLPRHQAAAWGLYRFAIAGQGGFSFGAGLRYLSNFHDGSGPRVPSVVVGDLLLAYENRNWRYALNVNNVTDKEYVSICLSRGDCWWAPRRNVVASATYRF